MKFSTKAIHVGQKADITTGAVVVPVYFTSTYMQDAIDKPRNGYVYSRTGNPSRDSLEKTIASLENGKYGLCFSSGSAATVAVLNILKPGDDVMTTIDVYGGTYRLFKEVYEKYGITFRCLDTSDAEVFAEEISPNTKIIWIESPTNPLLNILDIKALAKIKNEKTLLVVDNTFATPCFQTPLDLGADIVVHSTTKYLAGHSDVIGGAIVTNNTKLYDDIKFYQNAAGATPSPMDCFLVQRGIKTLEVRMAKHQSNAFTVANFLKEHPQVLKVFFPGLPEHHNHSIAKKQMSGQTGMISFTINGDESAVEKFFEKIKIFKLAESLGSVESLACYPYTMTHHSIPESEKNKIGISKNLIRLSIGLEDINDLLEDLKFALNE